MIKILLNLYVDLWLNLHTHDSALDKTEKQKQIKRSEFKLLSMTILEPTKKTHIHQS